MTVRVPAAYERLDAAHVIATIKRLELRIAARRSRIADCGPVIR